MRHSARSTIAAVLLLAASAVPSSGQDAAATALRIGVAAPFSGSSEMLGAQVAAGAKAVVGGRADVALVEADTECSAEGGKRAADALVAAKVAAAIGFLCTESLEAALPILTRAGIPVVDIGVRANRFTDHRAKTGALVWRLAPRSDAEADAVAKLLVARWRNVPFGLVDDGTIYGRGLADAVRSRLEADGLRPATIDTFRPAEEKQFGLVRRILATGVTRLFVAGDRPDVAIIARDAASLDLSLDIVGGEALIDEADPAVPLREGTLAVAPRTEFDEIRPAADGDVRPEARQGYFGPAFAGTQIAVAALRENAATQRPLAEILNGATFATALGPIRFDAQGDGDLDLFRVFRFDGEDFVTETGG